MLLKDRVSLVTGGSQGIGKAIVTLFAKEGSDVVFCARNMDKAKKTAEEIKKMTGRTTVPIYCDVSIREDVNRVIDTVMRDYGRIDVLVNNAAVQEFASFLDITEELWDKHFAINVKGTFLFSQGVAKKMKDKGGCKIINISSDSGVAPVPENAGAYCSSKSAVNGLTRVIAKEMGRYGIYCNAICPGGVTGTGMLENYSRVFNNKNVSDAELAALRKLATPEEVAKVALFLASDMSSHVTGERIMVTGGDIMTQ